MKITPKAEAQIKKNLNGKSTVIRIGVRSGGCDGFSYVIEFENIIKTEKDTEHQFDGFIALIDNKSIKYLNNCTLDWEETLMKQSFIFSNSDTHSVCGCGQSFSIK